MYKVIINLLAIITLIVASYAQSLTQSVRGKVYDIVSKTELPGVNIVVLNTEPVIGTTSDLDGNFELTNVPVGRHTIEIMMMGYQSRLIKEVLVSTGKQIILEVGLEEAILETGAIVVRVNKDVPINTMATLSSRQFTVEETQRYAGGLDDPARLASSFAGVATPSVSSNGISIRGNNPQGVSWRIEGVEVPNPNHFADLTVTGGGLLTALSSQMMGNSDFYTGAFPAEYGNATSGVFDINLNTGNTRKRQYTFQAGVIGIDFAAEGPFQEGSNSSYLMNYRYSTMGLVAPLLPEDTGILKYQDLAFKTNFFTQGAGAFSFWGIGALDHQKMTPVDSLEWKSDFDRDESRTDLYMYATGLSHKIALNSSTFLSSAISATGSGLTHMEKRLDDNMQLHPQTQIDNHEWRYTVQSSLYSQFNDRLSNQAGFSYSNLGYNLDIGEVETDSNALAPIVDQAGNSGLFQAYNQSKFSITPRLSFNIGVHLSYFMLNDKYSIEPRAGLKYMINDQHDLAIAYGVNSRIERLPVYFVNFNGNTPNKDLDLQRSTHYVLAYNMKLNPNLRLCIEPYYQRLSNIPVSPDSYISTINMQSDIFFNERLTSKGTGRNIGIDITLERFLHDGYYYLATASLFDSKYKDAAGITRNTRFNKNYVFNLLAGKEWTIGNNILNANFRLNYLGGNRKEPVDNDASILNEEVIYGETGGQIAFSQQFNDIPVFSVSVSYRTNKPNYSSIWTLQILNLTGAQEYSNDYFNLKTGKIETNYKGIMVPNLSYKIEF